MIQWESHSEPTKKGIAHPMALQPFHDDWESVNKKPRVFIIDLLNYNDLTATSLEIMVSKGQHLQDSLNSC